MKIIPFSGTGSFSEEVSLDGKPYRFRFDWNWISETWAMSIYTRELELLVASIKIVLDYELIGDYRYRGLPAGEMWAIDETNSIKKIARNDIGKTVFLAYVEEGEEL